MNKKWGIKLFKVCLTLALAFSLVISQDILIVNGKNETSLGKKMITYAKGSVVDETTGQKCQKATITYVSKDDNMTQTIKTDKNGDFIIDKLDTGYYSWYIECDGYQKGSFLSYPVISGGNNYLFEISKGQTINRTFERQTHTEGEPSVPYACTLVPHQSQIGNDTPQKVDGPPTPYLPSSVKVQRTSGTIVTVQLDDYIAHVVCREMDPNYYIYNGMSDAQKLTAMKAQAIVARGYATYHFYNVRRHSSSSGYDFCDQTHCQVYDPTYSPQLAIQAANDTSKTIPAIVSGSPGAWNIQYIDATFFASCTGATKNAKDVWGTDYSYLVSVPCPYDTEVEPSVGLLGHGVGFCQDGAAGYAKRTTLWPSDIVMHYYTGVTTVIGQY